VSGFLIDQGVFQLSNSGTPLSTIGGITLALAILFAIALLAGSRLMVRAVLWAVPIGAVLGVLLNRLAVR